MRELDAAVDEVRLAERLERAVITSRVERYFCGGADLGAFARLSAGRRYAICLRAHEVWRKIEATPIPFVAVLAGHALGGGLELALACDRRLAVSGDHRLGLPEVGVGLLPGSGGTQRLPRLIGLPRALDLIVTGRLLDVPEALAIGLVDGVLEDPAAALKAALACPA